MKELRAEWEWKYDDQMLDNVLKKKQKFRNTRKQ